MERSFVGLDVHARSFVACAFDEVTGEMARARLVPRPEVIWDWLRQPCHPPAGPTGRCQYVAAAGCDRRRHRPRPSLPPLWSWPSARRLRSSARLDHVSTSGTYWHDVSQTRSKLRLYDVNSDPSPRRRCSTGAW